MASKSSVPVDFPSELQGPMAWDGALYQTTAAKYIQQLSQDDVKDIDKALRHFQGLNLAPGFVSPKTFPLSPKLAASLANISKELHEGRGFGVLRGLNPSKYTPAENVIVFAGVASYVGEERATDPAGLTLSHIRNATKDKLPQGFSPEQLRPSKRPEAMNFHSDTGAGDILAMYVKDLQNHSGGTQYLASFWQIYNTLAKEAPHVLQTLASPFPWEEVDSVTEKPYLALRPIIFHVDNKVQVQFVTVPLRGSLDHPRPKELTPLTAAQEEALDKLQSVAQRLSLELDRAIGDIQFVNNFSILHGRTAYSEEASEKIDATTTAEITPKTDIALQVWAQMVTTIEVVTVTTQTTPINQLNTETKKITKLDTATKSAAAADPIISSVTVGDTVISTTGPTTVETATAESGILTTVVTNTTSTTCTTKTVFPPQNNVTVTQNSNSATTDPAFSQNIVTDTVDDNTSIVVTTTTTTSYAMCNESSAVAKRESMARRHILRLFLRDRTRAWRKPEIYHERIENCFAVPAAEQLLPETDFDPTKTTVSTGGGAHG